MSRIQNRRANLESDIFFLNDDIQHDYNKYNCRKKRIEPLDHLNDVFNENENRHYKKVHPAQTDMDTPNVEVRGLKQIPQRQSDIFNRIPQRKRESQSLPRVHHLNKTETTEIDGIDNSEYLKHYREEKDKPEYINKPKMRRNHSCVKMRARNAYEKKLEEFEGNYPIPLGKSYSEFNLLNETRNFKSSRGFIEREQLKKAKEERELIQGNSQRTISHILQNDYEDERNVEKLKRDLEEKSSIEGRSKKYNKLYLKSSNQENQFDWENALKNKIDALKSNIFYSQQKDNFNREFTPIKYRPEPEEVKKPVRANRSVDTRMVSKFDWLDSSNETWLRRLYPKENNYHYDKPIPTAMERKQYDLGGTIDRSETENFIRPKNLDIYIPMRKQLYVQAEKVKKENERVIYSHLGHSSVDKIRRQVQNSSYLSDPKDIDLALRTMDKEDCKINDNHFYVNGIKRHELEQVKKVLKDNGLHSYGFKENEKDFGFDKKVHKVQNILRENNIQLVRNNNKDNYHRKAVDYRK
ncbi:MAG: hypothetical protein MJ252_20875 [archaeon]|nr:hypothetical protein [archaeon]